MATKTIERGTAILDTKLGPYWPYDINLDRLDMSKSGFCVIGQTQGGWYLPEKVLGPNPTIRDQQKHGFMAWSFNPYSWQSLTRRWKRHIIKLQAERREM